MSWRFQFCFHVLWIAIQTKSMFLPNQPNMITWSALLCYHLRLGIFGEKTWGWANRHNRHPGPLQGTPWQPSGHCLVWSLTASGSGCLEVFPMVSRGRFLQIFGMISFHLSWCHLGCHLVLSWTTFAIPICWGLPMIRPIWYHDLQDTQVLIQTGGVWLWHGSDVRCKRQATPSALFVRCKRQGPEHISFPTCHETPFNHSQQSS